MAEKGPDRFDAWPGARAHLKRKGFLFRFLICIWIFTKLLQTIKTALIVQYYSYICTLDSRRPLGGNIT